jgi:hypothetical protein
MNQEQYLQPSTNYKHFDFEKSALIRPPFEDFKNKEVGNKFTRVVIDSRDRNSLLFPTPSSYDIYLDEELEDVTAAEILVMDVPFSTYLINQSNNKLVLVYGPSSHSDQVDQVHTVHITPGDYNGQQLASMIKSVTCSHTGMSMDVVYNALQDNFIFSSTHTFKIQLSLFPLSNLYKILGLDHQDHWSFTGSPDAFGNSNYVKSRYRKDFSDHKYIVMNIEQISLNVSGNTTINKSLALIPSAYSSLNHFSVTPIKKFFNPPIGRLTKLRLSFWDYYGNLYDFQNHDHRIDIMFESNKHLRRYKS